MCLFALEQASKSLLAAPYLIQFEKVGKTEEGFITTTQFADNVPFQIRRVFWTNGTPATAVRGQHANKVTAEVLIAVSGKIAVKTESVSGTEMFELASPEQGLYIPPLCWTELRFQENTISLCLASTDFDDTDYIRSYTLFKQLISGS